jgi:hypothetical protein
MGLENRRKATAMPLLWVVGATGPPGPFLTGRGVLTTFLPLTPGPMREGTKNRALNVLSWLFRQ